MRYYCTYFDSNYLLRGLALYRSLERHAQPFTLWVLCLDDRAYDVLTALKLESLKLVRLSELEAGDEALVAAKKDRSKVEYYFTCSPSWPRYLLNHNPEIDLITYLDGDLYFFSSPEPIFDEMGDNSILIIGHRFAPHLKHMEEHGVYNVGLMSFRNDTYGRECLEWWRDRCIEWCYNRAEDGRYADQKYLDDWPVRFRKVRVLEHPGAGLAPWNWMNHKVEWNDEKITVDGRDLIFCHYHGLTMFNQGLFDLTAISEAYGDPPSRLFRRLCRPYVEELKSAAELTRRATPGMKYDYADIRKYGPRYFFGKLRRGQLMVSSRM